MTEYGTWVYAVTPEAEPEPQLAGVAGEPVRGVTEDGLTAVVGTVPLATFGEEALRRNLESLDWLAGVARAHDAVVATVARSGPAVPFRMATVYFDDDRVRALLRDLGAEFRQTLARLTGRMEWGVKVTLDVSRVPEREPVGAAGSRPDRAGAAYLRRKREQQLVRERVEQLGAKHAQEIHAALAALAVDARLNRPHNPALSGQDRPMILNGAYLVADPAAAEFVRAVADQNSSHEELELEITGPWPAYSFASLGQRHD